VRERKLERRGSSAGSPSKVGVRTGAGARLKGASVAWAPMLIALALAACAPGAAVPQQPDSRNDLCSSCRMPVSDPSLAAQIVAPNAEPLFFDDLRCLRDYLTAGHLLPEGAVAYVADHRTHAWVKARQAVFASLPSLDTPMGSHWAAYTDEESRQVDPDAAGSSPLPVSELFGAAKPPGD
jgi:copper chaperone NosL